MSDTRTPEACLAQRQDPFPRICSKVRDHVGPHSWEVEVPDYLAHRERLRSQRSDRILQEFVELCDEGTFCPTTSAIIQSALAEVCRRLLP